MRVLVINKCQKKITNYFFDYKIHFLTTISVKFRKNAVEIKFF
jgi:hypothetical protein